VGCRRHEESKLASVPLPNVSYYSSVAHVTVPDCLKQGVTKCHIYDPDLNPAYAQLAAHYSTAAVPARAGRPKDKGLDENASAARYSSMTLSGRGSISRPVVRRSAFETISFSKPSSASAWPQLPSQTARAPSRASATLRSMRSTAMLTDRRLSRSRGRFRSDLIEDPSPRSMPTVMAMSRRSSTPSRSRSARR
jgi:hypothetical protein